MLLNFQALFNCRHFQKKKKPKKEKKFLIIFNFRKSVRLGEHTLSTDIDCNDDTGICNEKPQDFDIEEIIFHPEYGKPKVFRNDIALLRLAKPYNQSGKKCNFCQIKQINNMNSRFCDTNLPTSGPRIRRKLP